MRLNSSFLLLVLKTVQDLRAPSVPNPLVINQFLNSPTEDREQTWIKLIKNKDDTETQEIIVGTSLGYINRYNYSSQVHL